MHELDPTLHNIGANGQVRRDAAGSVQPVAPTERVLVAFTFAPREPETPSYVANLLGSNPQYGTNLVHIVSASDGSTTHTGWSDPILLGREVKLYPVEN